MTKVNLKVSVKSKRIQRELFLQKISHRLFRITGDWGFDFLFGARCGESNERFKRQEDRDVSTSRVIPTCLMLCY